MTSKRSKLEIYLDILKVIKRGTHKPTRIMYRTNLSWKPLMKILEALLEQDLIIAIKRINRQEFEITHKGREILSHFESALDTIKII